MSDYVEAQWGIPHCQFEKTAQGFKVRYSTARVFNAGRVSAGMLGGFVGAFIALVLAIYIGSATGSAGVFFIMLLVLVGAVIFLVARLSAGKVNTTIEVTSDAVIIDQKRLRREDFGSVIVDHSINLSGTGLKIGKQMAVLSYGYGNRNIQFGGMWLEDQAIEFVTSLNRAIKNTPIAGQENIISPETLRQARPQDF